MTPSDCQYGQSLHIMHISRIAGCSNEAVAMVPVLQVNERVHGTYMASFDVIITTYRKVKIRDACGKEADWQC